MEHKTNENVEVETKQHTELFNELVTKNNNVIYDNFNSLITNGNNNDILEYIKQFNIDLNYDDGYYMELLVEKNDITLIKQIIETKHFDIKLDNYGVLHILSFLKYKEMFDLMINHYNVDIADLKRF